MPPAKGGRWWLAAVVGLVIAIVGVLGAYVVFKPAPDSTAKAAFRKADPEGYAACKALVAGNSDASLIPDIWVEAGKHARRSKTPAIASSLVQMGSGAPSAADPDKLTIACQAKGYSIPTPVVPRY